MATKYFKSGKYRNVASGWNWRGTAYFIDPAGAKIRVKYGFWIFSWTTQKKTLNGVDRKKLTVGWKSIFYARMQIKVRESTQVEFITVPKGAPWDSPEIEF